MRALVAAPSVRDEGEAPGEVVARGRNRASTSPADATERRNWSAAERRVPLDWDFAIEGHAVGALALTGTSAGIVPNAGVLRARKPLDRDEPSDVLVCAADVRRAAWITRRRPTTYLFGMRRFLPETGWI